MKRHLQSLANGKFDAVVVGGGVQGAAVAWELSLRGYCTALVEQGDFGASTSSGTHRILHGGLRYLQQADLPRMRESIRERNFLMRNASHLVRSMGFLVPCQSSATRNPVSLGIALWLNDLVAHDRNRGLSGDGQLPGGQLVPRAKALELAPQLVSEQFSHAGLFFDGQMLNSERLTLAFVKGAVRHGTCAANYLSARRIHLEGQAVRSLEVRDAWTGAEFEIQTRFVFNMTGPAIHRTAAALLGRAVPADEVFCKGFQVVIPWQGERAAFCVPSVQKRVGGVNRGASRQLFIVPWNGCTVVGTTESRFVGDPAGYAVTRGDVAAFLDEIREACPAIRVRPEDVIACPGGIRPVNRAALPEVRAGESDEICHHARTDGVNGFISGAGVKYTTARAFAQRVVLAMEREVGASRPMQHERVLLPGGGLENPQKEATRLADQHGLTASVAEKLVGLFGSESSDVLQSAQKAGQNLHESSFLSVVAAYATENEMAASVADVLLRRAGAGLVEKVTPAQIEVVAELLGARLGWSPQRKAEERSGGGMSRFLPAE